jgi:NAD(P)-dependent dehydrogenase (short-subunit alcohol dehydrogenase family)
VADGGGALRGRAALLTGAGSGIGLACASALAADGAAVTIMGRNEDKLRAGAAAIRDVAGGGHVGFVVGDVGGRG